jgi:putative ABC transport system permease protein
MNSLFGIPMTGIMVGLLVVCGGCLGVIAWIMLRARLMFRMGVRNIPRRRAQSILIVLGLMLSTLIVSAAFTTGDTLNYSVTRTAYDVLGPLDLTLNLRGVGRQTLTAPFTDQTFVPVLADRLRADPDVVAVLPAARFQVPVINQRSRLGAPNAFMMGEDPAPTDAVHALQTPGGSTVSLSALAPGEVLINDTLRDKIDAQPGDVLAVYFDPNTPVQLRVANVVHATLLGSASGNFGPGANDPGGMVLPLATAQQLGGHVGQINFVGVSLRGGVRGSVAHAPAARGRIDQLLRSDPALSKLPFVSPQGAQAAGGFLGTSQGTLVRTDKADAVRLAETVGSVVTTVFVILGLFSVAAGVMLIFLIFVMLAAERKTEMGMLRALGVRRLGLVQAYLAEGTVYDVLSGLIGAGLGVAVSFGGVVGGTKLIAGGKTPIYAHVTARSLIVAYCLGLALTFFTVLVSAYRVSRLNISAAIRDLPETTVTGRERFARRGPVRIAAGSFLLVCTLLLVALALAGRQHGSVAPLIYLASLLGLGGSLLLVRGMGGPWPLAHTAAGLLLGGMLAIAGRLAHDPFPFQFGVSLLILGAAQWMRFLGRPSRPVYTVAGGVLFAYWALPQGAFTLLSGQLDTGGPEMFFLSGVMMVTGSTLLLVFNADLLTGMFSLDRRGVQRYLRAGAGLWLAGVVLVAALALKGVVGDTTQLLYLLVLLLAFVGIFGLAGARFTRFVPALKMAIAYPLASRFRTGMTIAMFSLIVFSLTLISTLNANFAAIFSAPDAQAGWDIRGNTVQDHPIADLRAALQQNGAPSAASALTVVGRRGHAVENVTRTEIRNAGETDKQFRRYSVLPVDDEYLRRNTIKLQAIADGYRDGRAVWNALATTPGLAVVDSGAVPSSRFRDPEEFALSGISSKQTRFAPASVDIRDARTGKIDHVTVIGVVDRGVSGLAFQGMVLGLSTFEQTFGPASLDDYFIRVAPGMNATTVAKQMRSALLTEGFQADAMSDVLGKQQQLQQGFTYLLQGFMGLGLFVGVAALGVIAFRSVVERRQQIGMLRALGFHRGTIAISFLLESTFIAILGILAGVVGATLLARNIFHARAFQVSGTTFFIPWQQVLVFVVIGYVFSLLMTIIPSRGAASIPIAEALRYE